MCMDTPDKTHRGSRTKCCANHMVKIACITFSLNIMFYVGSVAQLYTASNASRQAFAFALLRLAAIFIHSYSPVLNVAHEICLSITKTMMD